MIINDKYLDYIDDTPVYSNEAYLQLHVWQLQHVFCSEISAIKNTNLEFVAFSNLYAESFHLDEKALGKTIKHISSITSEIANEITTQELNMFASKSHIDTMFHYNYEKQYSCYIIRKRLIINPATTDIVGVFIVALPFDILQFRRFFINLIQNKIGNSNAQVNNIILSEKQRLIVTCLFLGYHKRKEIASMLENITEENYSELKIKNMLHNLFQQYQCQNIGELLDIVASDNEISFKISGVNIPNANIKI